MQVSWIDPEEVAALAESLRLPARPQPPVKVPEPALRQEAVQPLVADSPPPDAEVQGPDADTGEMPNLAAFRQRLQSIRERAISAGLMTPKAAVPPPEPPVTPAPETEGMRTGASALHSSPVAAPAPETEELRTGASALHSSPVAAPATETEEMRTGASALHSSPVAAPAPETEELRTGASALHSSEPAPQWQPQPETVEAPTPPPVQYNVPVSAPPVESFRPAPQPHIEIAPGASVKDRLDAFATWAGQQWGPSELLIVDEYGDLLWGPPKKAGLVLSTMMAWNAAIRASAQAANGLAQIQQQLLATGETLTIIPCKTRLGMLQIALVKAQAPWGEETSVLREALVQVMDIPG